MSVLGRTSSPGSRNPLPSTSYSAKAFWSFESTESLQTRKKLEANSTISMNPFCGAAPG